MATTTFHGSPVHTVGELPEVGSVAPSFTLAGNDLADVTSEFAGRTVLNIFLSLDTGVCAASVRRFNEIAADLDNTRVVNVSNDLPFAMGRFCGAEGIDHVITASAFRSDFGDSYGVKIVDSPLRGLLARSVVVIGADGTVLYTEQVEEMTNEPNYDAALAALGHDAAVAARD